MVYFGRIISKETAQGLFSQWISGLKPEDDPNPNEIYYEKDYREEFEASCREFWQSIREVDLDTEETKKALESYKKRDKEQYEQLLASMVEDPAREAVFNRVWAACEAEARRAGGRIQVRESFIPGHRSIFLYLKYFDPDEELLACLGRDVSFLEVSVDEGGLVVELMVEYYKFV